MFDTCAKYGIKVFLDVHTAKNSQNGFDNSGKANRVEWDADGEHFHHWSINKAEWLGPDDNNIDFQNVWRSLMVSEHLLQRWGNHSAFYAFEPVNEPVKPDAKAWLLKEFYRSARKLVQRYAP